MAKRKSKKRNDDAEILAELDGLLEQFISARKKSATKKKLPTKKNKPAKDKPKRETPKKSRNKKQETDKDLEAFDAIMFNVLKARAKARRQVALWDDFELDDYDSLDDAEDDY